MKEKLTELRVFIDLLSRLLVGTTMSELEQGSSQMIEAYKSLMLAKAWLGKGLAAEGAPTPYVKDGDRHSVKDIEETADTANLPKEGSSFNQDWKSKNLIEKIDWLREKIYNRTEDIENIGSDAIWKIHAHQHLSEARFHLGFELGRIRDSEQTLG